MLSYDKSLKHLSRKLRKDMTGAERLLWSRIRGKQLKGYQFYRQKIIGNYIVDFYCPKAKLVIEIDGGQHYSVEGKEKDRMREKQANACGAECCYFGNDPNKDFLTPNKLGWKTVCINRRDAHKMNSPTQEHVAQVEINSFDKISLG